MWIPNQYAALCLEEGLNPVETWSRIYGMILQDGATVACKPLIDFMRVQLMGDVVDNESFFDVDELPQPRPGRSFLRHRQGVLSHMMPTATTVNAPQASNALNSTGISMDEVRSLISTLQSGHTIPAPTVIQKSTTSSIENRWSVNLDSLLLFTLSGILAR